MEELVLETFSLWQEAHPNPEENMTEWARLIDDGWGLWGSSLDLLRQWLQFMNSQAPSVKYTMIYTCPKDCPVGCPYLVKNASRELLFWNSLCIGA